MFNGFSAISIFMYLCFLPIVDKCADYSIALQDTIYFRVKFVWFRVFDMKDSLLK